MLAKALFDVRPSALEAGTKRLLLTAQAIVDGNRDDRWGHHATPIVMQFCEFTASKGQPALPWQELVEDARIYDGKEGVSSRTGNRPLGTTTRYQLDASAFAEALSSAGSTSAEIASELGLPVRFIEAICSGEWPSISQYSLDKLKARLGDLDVAPIAINESGTATQAQSGAPARILGISLTLVILVVLTGWWVQRAPNEAMQSEPEVVGFWDYDAIDGQRVPDGLVLIEAPDAGMGAQWRFRLQLLKHEALPPRNRRLWPVELHRESRRVCVNYPGYPTYPGFVDLPGEKDDGVYRFGPCE